MEYENWYCWSSLKAVLIYPDTNLEKAMIDKKPYADYIVTQWLLDSQPIIEFISKQSVPVHVGITGPHENI